LIKARPRSGPILSTVRQDPRSRPRREICQEWPGNNSGRTAIGPSRWLRRRRPRILSAGR
jgi:hypothetical protein